MWSIYDTFVLATGIVVLAIAVVPVAGIPASTRLWSGAIGGGLTLLSLFLGSLRSFTYPSLVFAGPLIAALALGAVIADARKRTNPNQAGLPFDQSASGPLPSGAEAAPEPDPARVDLAPTATDVGDSGLPSPSAAGPVEETPSAGSHSASPEADAERSAAWLEVNRLDTTAERLAAIAGSYPEFGQQMLGHPNLYPALREWIQNLPGADH